MYECCEDLDNREEQDTGREDLTLSVCKTCGRRHFELTLDPTHYGVDMKSIG